MWLWSEIVGRVLEAICCGMQGNRKLLLIHEDLRREGLRSNNVRRLLRKQDINYNIVHSGVRRLGRSIA